jgi:predicted outer membrane repeat protein
MIVNRKMSRLKSQITFFLVLCLISLALLAWSKGLVPSASAAVTFTVNNTADTVDANLADNLCLDAGGLCSLRAAVQQSNATPGADIINIPAGTYTLTRVGTDSNAVNGDLDITESVTINGAGQATTIIQGGTSTATAVERVFQINPLANRTITTNISGVTIKFGRIVGTGGGAIYFDGFNGSPVGVLNITDSTISDSESGARGGGIRSFDGTLTITNSTISGNKTTNATGGGIDHRGAQPITITGSTITNNTAEDTTGVANPLNGRGGGLFFLQTTGGTTPYVIQNSTISNNKAEGKGGGVFMQGPTAMTNTTVSGNSAGLTGTPVTPAISNGGGIYSDLDPLTAGVAFDNVLDGVVVKGNTATGDGGGIFHDRDVLIFKNSDLGGSTVADKNMAANGGGLATFLDIGSAGQTGSVTIQNSTVRANVATASGGGIYNNGRTVAVNTNSTVGGPVGQGNTAATGGGIANNGGTLTVLGGMVKGNIATGSGGGFSSTGGTTSFDNVSINANAATANGGGIFNNGGTVNLINDSAIGNPANTAGGSGGGIASNGGTLTMTSGAIMNNTAAVNGGGVFTSGGTVNLVPSIATAVISIINNSAANSGGAIATTGGTTTVAKTNFSGNSATADGGGAIIHTNGSLTVNLSRIVGNSASDASSTGLKHSAGPLNATNNWWGCNIDPTITGNGCDTVSGTTAHNPRLVLNHTASPNQIPVNGTSTLNANFLTNSAGSSIPGSDLIVLGGLPVTFHNAVLGTISNADPLINNGQATATFTAGPVGGNGSADATVDNGTATAHITIEEAPTISCPADITVNAPTGQNNAVVNYPAPTTTGFPAPTVTCVPASGSTFPAGTTTVTCTATNGVNPDATCTFDVTVITNQPPVANAGADQTIECAGANTPVTLDGSASTDPDGDTPLTYAWTEGMTSLGSGVILNTTLSAGSHTITLTVTDPGGASDTDTVIINIVDTVAPVITVNGANPMTVECHTSFTDPGATANDGCSGSVPVTTSGTVDVDTPGTYTITYSATDGTNSSTATRTVNVVDTTAPVITVNGANPMTVECHTSFTDPGATANDSCAGSVTVTSSGTVDVDTPGTYTITYNATDPSGNPAVSKTRTVNVVDTTPPTITVNGPNPMMVECHTSFTDPGATASDSCAGSVAVTSSGTVDVNTPGTYTITYNASDPSGNAAAQQTRTVNVVDTTPPTITVNGANPMTVECHTSFTDPGATATDGCAGSVAVTSSGTVDPDTPGTYTITYNATDPSGNAAAPKTRTVNVVDTIAPVITLNGANPMTVECHTTFMDPGATANDSCAGSVPVTSSGSVNENVPGTYTITYTATDGTNTATKTRTVNVVDTTPPTITVNGPNPMTVECHTSFSDPGATANDSCAGSVAVTSSGSVNPNVVGTYTITYTATDGTNTVTATRTVNVVDTIAPVITLNGANPMTVECHTPFTDPGATANDGCAGNLTGSIVVSTNANPNVPGTYTITYSVSDGSNTTTTTRTVIFVDTTAPTITLIPNVNLTLWPPNHQYETININQLVASASDSCDPNIDLSDVYITKVTSDETENGNGDGNTNNDIIIAANCKSVQLRSERQGGADGRVYTIYFKVKDAAGNATTVTAKVKVPKNQGNNGGAVDSGVHYTVTSSCP